MGIVEFEHNEDGFFFAITEKLRWQVYPDAFDRVKTRVEQIISGRPTIDQFPVSKIETNDRFDLMKQARYQLVFFNDHWVTREEADEIERIMLDAYDDFHNSELAVFGSFPGMTVMCLMKDQGLTYLSVY